MSEEKKYMQFWFNNIHFPIIVNSLDKWPKDRPEEKKELFHVIEYGAVAELKAELDINQYATEKICDEIAQLKADLKIAVDAGNSISCHAEDREDYTWDEALAKIETKF